MNLLGLNQRIHYLRHVFTEEDLMAMQKHFEKLLESRVGKTQNGKIPSGALLLELLYACVRHRIWIAAPAFNNFLSAYIAESYSLSFPEVTEYISKIAIFCQKKFPKIFHLTLNSDREFLKYLVINIALAETEDTLTDSLGLGSNFINMIRRFLQEKIITDRDYYTSDPEHALLVALKELVLESNHKESYFHLKRFEYFLLDHQDLRRELHSPNFIIDIIQLLIHIALDSKSRGVSIPKHLLPILTRCDLIYLRDRTSRRSHYGITENAAELTSYFVYEYFLTQGLPVDPKCAFTYFNASYQKSLLRAFYQLQPDKCIAFINDHFTSINPKSLTLLLNTMSGTGFRKKLNAVIEARIPAIGSHLQHRELCKIKAMLMQN